MTYSVGAAEGREAFLDAMAAFDAALRDLTEMELLQPSRCVGWTRLDVAVHVLAGYQEMMLGLVRRTDDAPTVDAAGFWPVFASAGSGTDEVDVLMEQRRRTAAYRRPAGAMAQLADVAAALRDGVATAPETSCAWFGQVFRYGDYLACWAVELVVHLLDLEVDAEVPQTGLVVARRTVEELVGAPLPTGWSDTEAVLIGAGRVPVPAGRQLLAAALPVI